MRDPFMPLFLQAMKKTCACPVDHMARSCTIRNSAPGHSNHGNQQSFMISRVGTPNRNNCRPGQDPAQQDITKQTHRSWPLLSLSFQGWVDL